MKFGRDCAAYDYPMQAAHSIDGWEAVTGDRLPFVHIVVETEEPNFVTVGQLLTTPSRQAARMRAALIEYADRESSGDWPEFGLPHRDRRHPRAGLVRAHRIGEHREQQT